MRRNVAKRKADPKHQPAEKYSRGSYELAIDRACDRAFPPSDPLAQGEGETHGEWWGQRKHGKWIEGRLTPTQKAEVKEWRKAHRWSPNQLRHSYATKVRKEHGLEAAQVLLGHSRADVTQIYAEKNEAMAADIASKIG
jgi:integrase